MSRRLVQRALPALTAAAIAAATAMPAPARAADPVLMFLLSFARDLIEQHAAKRNDAPPVIVVPDTYPGTTVEPALVRRLIDDCFIYLSESQRQEIFTALHEALMDPRNAAVRAPMIEHFASRALAARAMQLRLAQFTDRDKQVLASEFRAEAQSLDDEERSMLVGLLRQGLLPVPADINAMLLASIDERLR